jgi:hypothetical protein
MSRFNPFQQNEDALPPEEVRILDLHAEPWQDGRRIRVHITLTPFQQPPNLEASIYDLQGNEVSHASIIENIDDKLVITMHLRDRESQAEYWLEVSLSFPEMGTVAKSSCSVIIPES